MNAGKLRTRVSIERDMGDPGTAAQHHPKYVVVGFFYAQVECLGSGEVINASQKLQVVRYKVTLRAGVGLLRPTDVLKWRGKTLQVTTSYFDETRTWLTVEATCKN